MTAKIVEFKRENWRDAVRTLRVIADELESGVHGPCKVGVLSMLTDSGKVSVFAFGPNSDDLQALAMFRLGEQKLVDILLDIETEQK